MCGLHKYLYGLKQAPCAWFEKLYTALLQLGFVSSKSNQSLFLIFTPQHTAFILVYVDDILITRLNQCFALKDLGEVDYFLGIQVKHSSDGIHLSETKF